MGRGIFITTAAFSTNIALLWSGPPLTINHKLFPSIFVFTKPMRMSLEIERKFLVKDASYRSLGSYMHIRQGFLSTDKERVVRVRIQGKKAFLTIKGITKGISRAEYEYKLPITHAKFMLDFLCIQPTIEKYRYNVNIEGFTWEIDEFTGDNEGLVIAEIELLKDDQQFPKPEWIGEEVTGDTRYYNANLVKNPYKHWKF